MKVAVNRLGKFSRSKLSRSNVPRKYAFARRFFARLASEIFLSSLPKELFSNRLFLWKVRHVSFRVIPM